MSSNEKQPNYSSVSPTGVFRFPKLITPDYGTEQYPKEDGEYNVRLVLSDTEAEAFKATLVGAMSLSKAQAGEKFNSLNVQTRKKLVSPKPRELGSEVFDKNENATGEIEFRFSTKASGVDVKTGDKWSKKVPLFNSNGQPLEGVTDIWSGSVGRIAFEAVPYFVNATGEYGVTLRMKAVQVLQLRSGGDKKDAKAYGFTVEPTSSPTVSVVNTFSNEMDTQVTSVPDNIPF